MSTASISVGAGWWVEKEWALGDFFSGWNQLSALFSALTVLNREQERHPACKNLLHLSHKGFFFGGNTMFMCTKQ